MFLVEFILVVIGLTLDVLVLSPSLLSLVKLTDDGGNVKNVLLLLLLSYSLSWSLLSGTCDIYDESINRNQFSSNSSSQLLIL